MGCNMVSVLFIIFFAVSCCPHIGGSNCNEKLIEVSLVDGKVVTDVDCVCDGNMIYPDRVNSSLKGKKFVYRGRKIEIGGDNCNVDCVEFHKDLVKVYSLRSDKLNGFIKVSGKSINVSYSNITFIDYFLDSKGCDWVCLSSDVYNSEKGLYDEENIRGTIFVDSRSFEFGQGCNVNTLKYFVNGNRVDLFNQHEDAGDEKLVGSMSVDEGHFHFNGGYSCVTYDMVSRRTTPTKIRGSWH